MDNKLTTDCHVIHSKTHAYDVLNPEGRANIIFICEHASNYLPPKYKGLGLENSILEKHIAWDIGMAQLTRQLSMRLNAPAILATFSRLLIDPNREEDHPNLIPLISDDISIPGNQNLALAEVRHRLDTYYHSFHDRAHSLVKSKLERGQTPLICGMHSFTPTMNGVQRPWQAGMLWNKDPRLSEELMTSLSLRGYHVGNNQPYSGKDLFFTMNRHGDRHGIPHATIEIRQDEVDTPQGRENWAQILTEDLKKIAKKIAI